MLPVTKINIQYHIKGKQSKKITKKILGRCIIPVLTYTDANKGSNQKLHKQTKNNPKEQETECSGYQK